MPLGSMGYEVDAIGGQRYVWLAPAVVDRLRSLRGPGESYSAECPLPVYAIGLWDAG